VPEGFGGARAALAWTLGTYRFARYRKKTRAKSRSWPCRKASMAKR
jgi:hypothetical protein